MINSQNIYFSKREDKKSIETNNLFAPKFDSSGLIVAIAQDINSNKILMVAYMSEESLKMTLEKGEAVYFSRSRNKIWHKGATSGQTQIIKKIEVDCDQDALILKVEQNGTGCCHVGHSSCFYRKIDLESKKPVLLNIDSNL